MTPALAGALLEPAPLLVEPVVRAALLEDFGRAGDVTTDAIVDAGATAAAAFVARRPGRIAGLACARIAFSILDPEATFEVVRGDASDVDAGETIARVRGKARAILSGERTALNLLSRLSGIATATRALVERANDPRVAIACTRKTTPGLRFLEKYAVRVGGGKNHRFGLDDAVLIKDNHVIAAGGVRPAIERARAAVGHLVKIEVEVDTLEQLREALATDVDVVMLDNMTPEQLRAAVDIAKGRVVLEASGSVTLDTIAAIAATGVDVISAGWLTHSAPSLDIGLDFV